MTRLLLGIAALISIASVTLTSSKAVASDATISQITDVSTIEENGASKTRTISPCSWSFFGDPRSVMRRETIYTGCITPRGQAKVESVNVETGKRRVDSIFRGMEVDDHNNPSLVFFRRKLYAFASEHAGYVFPRDRNSRMEYRVLSGDREKGGTWGPRRQLPLQPECGLGYTYPNPVVSGRRLYLFMRGPCWYPYFSSTGDGKRWSRPKTLVLGPPSRGRKVRPYAKYASTDDGSILMTFSDGHPGTYKNNLYFMRLKNGIFYRADGSRIGTRNDLPFRISQLDMVQRYSPSKGRPWPMDIAYDSGKPVIVYSSRVGYDDVFRYARWSKDRGWQTQKISDAGGDLFGYRNGGVTFNHDDPSWIALTRQIDGQHEIELLNTRDDGDSWDRFQLTQNSSEPNFRPVFPRGQDDPDQLVVTYVSGKATNFRSFQTVIKMNTRPKPRPTPEPTPTPPSGPAPVPTTTPPPVAPQTG